MRRALGWVGVERALHCEEEVCGHGAGQLHHPQSTEPLFLSLVMLRGRATECFLTVSLYPGLCLAHHEHKEFLF